MTVLIVAEKPSAARNFAKALGGMSGAFEGTAYAIVPLRGHLYEFADVADQVPAAQHEHYKKWALSGLPWDETQFAWKRMIRGDAAAVARALKTAAQGVDEIVCGTDLDPSGEGALLFAEPILEQGIAPRRLTRMYFTDEAEQSIQKAFRSRKPVPDNDITRLDEYKRAITRAKFDFLSQQLTRVASLQAGTRTVLRQGRLKSAMLLLVGDQLRAHNGYVKTVSYQNRFRDDHDVLYTDPDQPVFKTEAEARAAGAQLQLRPGPVLVDSRTMKNTAPPRLLDLAALSSRLAPKGARPAEVLKVYQQMYEAQVVSYPRTEDRVITRAQFDELLPLVDSIANVVGVATSLLTHRSPRSTHVKDGGAHGANRPGLKVPGSLAQLEGSYGRLGRAIYEELARSFLAMFAPDYRYEAQVGHVEPFPSFVGRVAVPVAAGWKQVFGTGEVDPDENAKGLGSQAQPCVFEVVPKRPEHPTMAWLMKQLEKWDVGTGATRTSTYAELTRSASTTNKYPLMADTRGKTTLTEFGEQGYRLLPGTKIGDLEATAWVYAQMKAVAEDRTTTEAVLAVMADWVRHDIEVMGTNAVTMRKELNLAAASPPRDRYSGVLATTGERVSFNRELAGYRFTDAQCEALLRGEVVASAAFVGKSGNTFEGHGRLGRGTYNGKQTFGFQLVFGPPPDAQGRPQPPSAWLGHTFTAAERTALLAGEGVTAMDFISKKGKSFQATVRFKDEGKGFAIVPEFAKR